MMVHTGTAQQADSQDLSVVLTTWGHAVATAKAHPESDVTLTATGITVFLDGVTWLAARPGWDDRAAAGRTA